ARDRPAEEVHRVEEFFDLLHRPIDFAKEEGAGSDNLQARVMGILCLIYGGFILLLMLIPNQMSGRIAFAFCGLTMFLIGVSLVRASRGRHPHERNLDDAPPIIAETPAGEALATSKT